MVRRFVERRLAELNVNEWEEETGREVDVLANADARLLWALLELTLQQQAVGSSTRFIHRFV